MGELCSKLRLKVIRNSTKSNYYHEKQTNKQTKNEYFVSRTLLHNNMVDENFGTDYLDNCGKVL